MRIHYFQHVQFEDPGGVADWIDASDHTVAATRFFDNESPPNINEVDWLIVMGGPMGVNDEDRYSWLKEEKTFIREAIRQNKIVLGICLGAQLIAETLGAEVYPNKLKEIGWFPIRKKPDNDKHGILSAMPREHTVFHWHGDTFDIPEGAVCLAGSDGCANQAFSYGSRVLALQFHLEITPDGVARLVENCSDEIVSGAFIQSAADILTNRDHYENNQRIMSETLTYFEKRGRC